MRAVSSRISHKVLLNVFLQQKSATTVLDLSQWPLADRRQIIGVFTDVDDTLTTHGAITPDALQALHDLKASGLHVVPITGRPIGWSEPLAREWPVDALVAENGAVAWVKAPIFGKKGRLPVSNIPGVLSKIYQSSLATRAQNHARMQQVAQEVLRAVPGATLSQDSPGRETDIAIDHSEFVHLPPAGIAQVVQIMQAQGMHASVSSIHINGWLGEHHKLAGARWIVRQLWGRDLDAEIHRWVYVGDSTNDQLMFEAFPHSVGVANIARFLPELKNKPRYVTQGARGAGFAQVAGQVCLSRPT